MVNRYDNPAQAEFMNTYVPIPFEQLYKLGKEAKEDVEQAMKDYTSTLDKWGEFISPSQKDMQTYYNETVGRFAPIASEMAANPEAWKDASFRAKMYSTINNTDRAKLSGLKQSADFMRERLKVNQKLMLENKFNEMWHGIDFTNYDTTKQGVFQDVSPLAYKSVRDLSDPYMKHLEPGYIKTEGSYDYYGNTKGDIEKTIAANFNDIVNTPEARKHMEMYMKQTGADAKTAMQWFQNELVDTNLDRTERWKRVANDFAKMDYANTLAMRKKAAEQAGKEQGGAGPDIYDQHFINATETHKNTLKNDASLAGIFAEENAQDATRIKLMQEMTKELNEVWNPALKSGDITQEQYDKVLQDYEEQLKGLPERAGTNQKAYRQKFTSFSALDPTAGISRSWTDEQKTDAVQRYMLGATRLMDYNSTSSDPALDAEYNKRRYGDEMELSINGAPTRGYIVPTKGVKLDASLAAAFMGTGRNGTELTVEDANGRERNFEDMLSNGEFGNVIMVPKNAMFTAEDRGTGNLGYRNTYYISTAAISNQLKMSASEVENYFRQKFGNDAVVENIDAKEYSDTATKTRYNTGKYIKLDGNELIPASGTRRLSFDQAGEKVYGTGASGEGQNYSSNRYFSNEGYVRELYNYMQ